MKHASLPLLWMIMIVLISASERHLPAAGDKKKLTYAERSVSEWVEIALTADPSSTAGRDAFIAIANLNEVAVLSQILAVLKTADAPRRLHAIYLICSLPSKSEVAVLPLITALKDEDDAVRSCAAFALSKFGPKAQSAVQPLSKALKDKEERVRYHAAAALACIDSHREKDMVAYLGKVAKKGNPRSRTFAIYALGNIRSKEALVPLTEALKDEDEDVRIAAVSGLQEFGSNPEAVVPALICALDDVNIQVRQKAAKGLGAIGPGAKAAVRPLIVALQDDNESVRWNAAGALGAIGAAAKSGERPLVVALEDDNPIVRVQAACALGRINSGRIESMVPHLLQALQHEDASVRIAAIGALTAFGSKAKVAVKPLTEALKDPDALVRCTAAFALKKIEKEKGEAKRSKEKMYR